MAKQGMMVAYMITEHNNRSYWNRIGMAFPNSDGSINVRLNAFPVNGEIQLRPYVPDERPESSEKKR